MLKNLVVDPFCVIAYIRRKTFFFGCWGEDLAQNINVYVCLILFLVKTYIAF